MPTWIHTNNFTLLTSLLPPSTLGALEDSECRPLCLFFKSSKHCIIIIKRSRRQRLYINFMLLTSWILFYTSLLNRIHSTVQQLQWVSLLLVLWLRRITSSRFWPNRLQWFTQPLMQQQVFCLDPLRWITIRTQTSSLRDWAWTRHSLSSHTSPHSLLCSTRLSSWGWWSSKCLTGVSPVEWCSKIWNYFSSNRCIINSDSQDIWSL